MKSRCTLRGALCGALLFPVCFSLIACESDDGPGPVEAAEPEAAPVDLIVPADPIGPSSGLPANELGEIMVLEYHRLGEPEGEFYRSATSFRADLERLYEAGFRPITVRQMVSGEIDLPSGTSPVVFTIDDSSLGQFYLLDDGTIDPNSMVGIWEAFRREHPGWEGGATWCVLPAADYPSNFFGERPRREVAKEVRENRIQRKVDYLIGNGHEICNHTLYHARLDKAKDDLQVQEWIGRGEDSVRVYLPEDYDIATFALPLGMWPKNRQLAKQGAYKGRKYSYEAVLEVTGGPSESPFSVDFDPFSIPRVIVAPGALTRKLDRYRKHPSTRYVSDGLPGTIAIPARDVDRFAQGRWPDRTPKIAGESPTRGHDTLRAGT